MSAGQGRVAGLILAGGLGRRLGGVDKALVCLAGRPLLAHVRERLEPQVAALALSANGAAECYAWCGLPVLADASPDHPGQLAGPLAGPLAGVVAGLGWASGLAGVSHLLTAPVDGPFLPADLAARLAEAAGGRGMAWAESAGRAHPVTALWPLAAAPLLAARLAAGERRMMAAVAAVVENYGGAAVAWAATPADPFANLNTPGDFVEAEDRLCHPSR